ncbi:Fe(3+) dicitrate transport ATP-binding protein FecE [compost metagenome]
MRLGELAQRRFDQLSGGERARARLARALAVGSPLLLADEPVAALDPFHQLNVMELLRQQCAQGKTALVVLHDLTLASRFCDRILLLDQGRVVDCGSTRQVLTPKNLQQVYKVQAMLGEHQQQRFVLPWSCRPESHQAQENP